MERDVDRAACRDRGIDIVRRISGGRAVLHDAELTYCVAAPAGLPGFGTGLDQAYRLVAAGLVAGLRLLGVAADQPERGPARRAGSTGHPACFAIAARHEIQVGGRKLVGSAQRRRDGAFLQHGSILFGGHGAALAAVLRGDAGDAGARMVGLAELLEPCPGPAEVVAALAAGCAAAWECRFLPGEPDEGENREAAGIAARRRSGEWSAGRPGACESVQEGPARAAAATT